MIALVERPVLWLSLVVGASACAGTHAPGEQPPELTAAPRERPPSNPGSPADGDPRMRLAFSPSHSSTGAEQQIVLEYVDTSGPRSIDTNVGGTDCTHDARLECSWDPARVRLRTSCLTGGVGGEAEVVADEAGTCSLRARTIDAAHASRGIAPEWTILASVPCPPPGQPCPHE